MVARRLFAVSLGSAVLAGCVSDGGLQSASLGGTSWGGFGGGSTEGQPSTGFVAAPGGLLGGNFGSSFNEVDRQRALAAETTALETGGPGSPVGWRGDAGVYGTVIAGPAYNRSGYVRCRDYSHTVFVQGKPQLSRGIACRSPEGQWVAVS